MAISTRAPLCNRAPHEHISHGMNVRTPQVLRRMYDKANAGSVDLEEFTSLHTFILQTQDDFRLIDRDNDGKLSQAEVFSALEHAGERLRNSSSAARGWLASSTSDLACNASNDPALPEMPPPCHYLP
jgi:hypothetical protein